MEIYSSPSRVRPEEVALAQNEGSVPQDLCSPWWQAQCFLPETQKDVENMARFLSSVTGKSIWLLVKQTNETVLT